MIRGQVTDVYEGGEAQISAGFVVNRATTSQSRYVEEHVLRQVRVGLDISPGTVGDHRSLLSSESPFSLRCSAWRIAKCWIWPPGAGTVSDSVTSAVVGMRDPFHVQENLALARIPPADPKIPEALFARATST